jgi:hypothetical protein
MLDRTYKQAVYDVEYAIRLYSMHCRFHTNAAKWVTFIELFAGSSAFVSAIGDFKELTAASGLAITLIAAANHAWGFNDRAREFRELVKAMVRVRAECDGKTVAQIDAASGLAALEAPPIIEGLRVPAYNDVMRQTAQEKFVRKLTFWQWLMWKIA